MDRRTTIKWMIAAAGSMPSSNALPWGADETTSLTSAYIPTAKGYGSDPRLLRVYNPGQLWPLAFTLGQRRTAKALCDLIIPADRTSASASQVGVVEFLDEWISAPYKIQRQDRAIILNGFRWLENESKKRFRRAFAALAEAQQRAICDDVCFVPKAKLRFAAAARFFARYRDLTAGGFYTTPEGRKDLQYVGNSPLQRFEGPPLEVLKKVGIL